MLPNTCLSKINQTKTLCPLNYAVSFLYVNKEVYLQVPFIHTYFVDIPFNRAIQSQKAGRSGLIYCNLIFNNLYHSFISVTGNPNFNMQRTTFTIFGFTQTYTPFPMIEHISNNAKGIQFKYVVVFTLTSLLQDVWQHLDQEEWNSVKYFKEQLLLHHFMGWNNNNYSTSNIT